MSKKIEITSLYLGEVPDGWYRGWLAKFNTLNWYYFMEELYRRFGRPSWKDFMEEFTKLFQKGTVLDYLKQFEYLSSFMNADNPTLSKIFFISNFISSLMPEVQLMIKLLKPWTLTQIFEHTLLEEQSVIELSQSLYLLSKDVLFQKRVDIMINLPRTRGKEAKLRRTVGCYKCGDWFFQILLLQ